jgi:hypothetical protein
MAFAPVAHEAKLAVAAFLREKARGGKRERQSFSRKASAANPRDNGSGPKGGVLLTLPIAILPVA